MGLIKHVSGLKLLISSLNNLTPYRRAVLELVIAGAIWGASFTCVRWALEDFTTASLIFWRFLLAFIIGEILMLSFSRQSFRASHRDIRTAALCGFALSMSLIFQTHGMNFTTATKASFITSLYVVLLPVVGALFFKHVLRWFHIVLSLLAFGGMALLLDLPQQIHASGFGSLELNIGDLLTFCCAIASTFHILWVGQAVQKIKSDFRFNNYQTFWALLCLLPFLIYEMVVKKAALWPDHVSLKSLGGVVALALFVSLIAFYLQVRAQKVLSTATASMLCLLEAPYAFLFAALLLGERLDSIQIAGAICILLSSALSVYMDRPKNRDN